MKTNYFDWSSMMRVMLRAWSLWTTVKEDAFDEVKDQMAMVALLRGMPLEMASTLALKPSTKAAWDHLESSRLGFDRARMLSAVYPVDRCGERRLPWHPPPGRGALPHALQ
jgi:hypothetical protein